MTQREFDLMSASAHKPCESFREHVGDVLVDSPAGTLIGFTSDRFAAGGRLWKPRDSPRTVLWCTRLISRGSQNTIEPVATEYVQELLDAIVSEGCVVEVCEPVGYMVEVVKGPGWKRIQRRRYDWVGGVETVYQLFGG